MTELRNHAQVIWSIAELLRGDYKQSDYGRVILRCRQARRWLWTTYSEIAN